MPRRNAQSPAAAGRVGALRGASVEVDARTLGTAVGVAVLLALLVAGALLLAAAVHRNAQVADLRAHGVPVDVTVTGCIGGLGGSGSNEVSYLCTGVYRRGGNSHTVTLPDSADHAKGSVVREVTVPDDPGLVATPAAVRGERVEAKLYILPVAMLVVAVGGAATWIVARRRRQAGGV